MGSSLKENSKENRWATTWSLIAFASIDLNPIPFVRYVTWPDYDQLSIKSVSVCFFLLNDCSRRKRMRAKRFAARLEYSRCETMTTMSRQTAVWSLDCGASYFVSAGKPLMFAARVLRGSNAGRTHAWPRFSGFPISSARHVMDWMLAIGSIALQSGGKAFCC